MRSLLSLVVLVACAPDPTPRPPDAGSPARAADTTDSWLMGTRWVATEIAGRPVLARTRPTLRFAPRPPGVGEGDGSIRGFDGCNAFGVGYRNEAGRFRTVGDQISQLQGCLPAVMEQANTFTAALNTAASAHREGNRLVLADSTGAPVLVLGHAPARSVDGAALRGGQWRLKSVETLEPPPGPPMPPPPPVPPPPPPPPGTPPYDPGPPQPRADLAGERAETVVAFAPDGTFRATAGCVVFRGTYGVQSDEFSVTSLERDDGACPDRYPPDVLGLQQGQVEVSADRLTFYDRSGARTVFVR